MSVLPEQDHGEMGYRPVSCGRKLHYARSGTTRKVRESSIGAVNPALTTMANAIRAGEHLLERLR